MSINSLDYKLYHWQTVPKVGTPLGGTGGAHPSITSFLIFRRPLEFKIVCATYYLESNDFSLG